MAVSGLKEVITCDTRMLEEGKKDGFSTLKIVEEFLKNFQCQ